MKSALQFLEIEALVALGVFAFAYGTITFVLWRLSRDSEKRQRQRERAEAEKAAAAVEGPAANRQG